MDTHRFQFREFAEFCSDLAFSLHDLRHQRAHLGVHPPTLLAGFLKVLLQHIETELILVHPLDDPFTQCPDDLERAFEFCGGGSRGCRFPLRFRRPASAVGLT